jgi:hypothetical protein
MSAFKHTPAPWLLEGATIYTLHQLSHVETNRWSASVQPYIGCPNEEAQANAVLMQTAPELLEALKQVMGWIDNWSPEFTQDPDWSEDRYKARTVILKAIGKQV